MRILFIRHAESTFNATRRFPTKDVALSERGKIEAHMVARRVHESFPTEAIIASDLWRSQQTAEILESLVNVEVEYSDLFREVRRPSSILGRSVFSPKALWVNFLLLLRGHNPAYRYSDEESLGEVRERAQSALNHLVARTESHIVVVSHEMFIKAVLETMALGSEAKGATPYRLFRPFVILRNGSITECSWDGSWHINSVNQTSHLRSGDVSFVPR